ncbi:MAG TPA: SRPBCC family protein [Thermoleophilaceae bacterium]|jgi:uncharacterized membrane protein|nr:SRPBCC family protein [Thermoleophilaceae bacterium]
MAKDVADALGTAIGRVAREAAKNVQVSANKRSRGGLMERVNDAVSDRMNGALSGPKGVAAGAGLATLVPLVAKGAGKLARGTGDKVGGKVSGKVSGKVKDAVGDQVEKAGGAGGIAKEAGKSMLPGGGGDKKKGQPGVGKGRRMPFQWDIDIGVPLEDVYKHWTDYEEWPNFMHRLQSVSQEDDDTVKFKAKIWGISREFTAEICDEQENQRIKWKVTEGLTHQGVVTFHELAPRLTRVEVSFDVEPGGMIEKAARGMRHVKRAARADLSRFKAYVLMEEDGSSSSGSEQREQSSSRSSSSRPRSATKRSSSSSSSSGNGRSRASSGGRKRSSSSSGRKQSSSSGRTRASSSGGQKRSSSGGQKTSSGGGQKRSASKRSSSSSSNGRSSSSRTRASSSGNGRSSSSRTQGSSNGRSSSSAKKRSGSRS